MKVGEDLAPRAREFLRDAQAHRARCGADRGAVPEQSRRAALPERRAAQEHLSGGVPAWSWLGLKPLLDESRLDALYINFISGWELDLETAQLIRQHFRGPIYCDLH